MDNRDELNRFKESRCWCGEGWFYGVELLAWRRTR